MRSNIQGHHSLQVFMIQNTVNKRKILSRQIEYQKNYYLQKQLTVFVVGEKCITVNIIEITIAWWG